MQSAYTVSLLPSKSVSVSFNPKFPVNLLLESKAISHLSISFPETIIDSFLIFAKSTLLESCLTLDNSPVDVIASLSVIKVLPSTSVSLSDTSYPLPLNQPYKLS